jgi:hypothetical protein
MGTLESCFRRCGPTDSVARCNLAWHDFSPVNVSIIAITAYHSGYRFGFVFVILLLHTFRCKEEPQCEEVDKFYDADETKPHKKATDAAEVT